MTMATTHAAQIDKVISVDARGYAVGVGCKVDHGGNGGLMLHQTGYWACQGCGHFATSGDVLAMQRLATAAGAVRS